MRNNIHLAISSLALIGVATLFVTNNSNVSKSKIAYVETLKLMESYPPMKRLGEEVKIKTAIAKSRMDSINNSIEIRFRHFDENRTTMSKIEQERSYNDLQERRKKAQQYSERIQMKMQQDNQEVMKDMMNEINAAVKTYGQEHNYEIILGASGNGNLAYADKAIDITDELIEELNASF